MSLAAPLLRRLPSDITLQLFRREPVDQRAAVAAAPSDAPGVTIATR